MKNNSNEKGITLIILVLIIIVILILTSITVPAVTQKISQINEKREENYQKNIQEEIKYDIEQARKNGLIQGTQIQLNVLENILVKYNGQLVTEDDEYYIVLNNDTENQIAFDSMLNELTIEDTSNTVLLLHGEDFTDSSSKKNSIVSTNVTISDDGFIGKCFYFSGVSGNNILITNNSNDLYSGNNPFTIDFWMKHTTLNGTQTIYSHGGSNQSDGTGGVITGGASSGRMAYYCSGFKILKSSEVRTNQWYHVALIGNSSDIKLYLDGKLIGTYVKKYNFTNEPLKIGTNQDSSGERFYGYIDEFRISTEERWPGEFTPPEKAYQY